MEEICATRASDMRCWQAVEVVGVMYGLHDQRVHSEMIRIKLLCHALFERESGHYGGILSYVHNAKESNAENRFELRGHLGELHAELYRRKLFRHRARRENSTLAMEIGGSGMSTATVVFA